MEARQDNGNAEHAENGSSVHGCGLADNIDVRLARLEQSFNCGALQVQ